MAQIIAEPTGPAASSAGKGLGGLWDRQLPHYPPTSARYRYLALTVLATIVLYYELYIPGAVATHIIADYDMGFTMFVTVSIIGNLLGAFASLVAGLADRWGRANSSSAACSSPACWCSSLCRTRPTP